MKNLVINLFHIVLLHIILMGCALYNDPITPVIAEVTAVTTPTNDSTPDYTFSSDEAGTITYGGSCSSGIASAISGNNTITLVSLSDGTYSDCTITVTDSAGNVSNTLTLTTFIVDITAVAFSSLSPSSSSTVNSTAVGYTLGKAIASGTVTYTRTSGTTDNSSPHTVNLTGTELNSGTRSSAVLTNPPTLVSGTIYTIAFNGTDAGGNSATEVSVTGITYDTTAPAFSSPSPSSNSTVNTTAVGYTLNEAIASGTVTYTRTGGEASSDFTVNLTGSELNSGTRSSAVLTNPPNLISGTIYTIAFNGTDAGGNSATEVSRTGITYDTTAPTVTSVSTTADNGSSVSITDNITVTFSEAMLTSTIDTTTSGDNSTPSCAGSIQMSSPKFDNGTCFRMTSGPVASNSNRTFTLDPVDNLTVGTTYKITVTTAVQDTVGNAMSSQYDNSSGFTIAHYALDFDGTDDNVSANGVAAELDSDNLPLSVSAWVYPENATKDQFVFGFYRSSPFNQGPGVWYGAPNDKFSYYDKNGNNAQVLKVSSADYSINNWHHVVFTIGSDREGELYVNGSSAGSPFTLAFNAGGLDMFIMGVELDEGSGGDVDLIVNGGSEDPSQFFDGKIDEVAVWNDELTSTEVTTIYNSGYPLDVSTNTDPYDSAANLIGYYRFNEGSGTSLQDNSTNSNTGTITGATWTTGSVSE